MHGNLGRAVVKTSAIREQHRIIKAPAEIFHSQAALKTAFENDELITTLLQSLPTRGHALMVCLNSTN